MEYLSSLYRSAKRAVRRWFTLGLEDEFSQYDALSEYRTSLSADNLALLRDYTAMSFALLALLALTRCLLDGFAPVNILPSLLTAVSLFGIRYCLLKNPFQVSTVKSSYYLTLWFNLTWFSLSLFYDVFIHPERPAVITCLCFLVLTELFNTYPQDNILGSILFLFGFLVLDCLNAPLSVVLLDFRNCILASSIGVYFNQRSTHINIREKLYTNMYQAATRTSILVGQADLVHNSFEVLQCPDYMEETLLHARTATDVLEQIRDSFLDPAYREEFAQVWDWDTLPDRMAGNDQLSFYFQDFRQVWYQMVLVGQAHRNGKVASVIAIVRDVDDEKRREMESQQKLQAAVDEARRANAAKTNFLSRMSHDIRTPLNGILGLVQISEAHSDDRQLVDSNRKKIMVSANHLLSLINDVLQMSKLESGELVLAHDPFDLNLLAPEIIGMIQERAASAGITMIYDAEHSDRIQNACVYGSPLHIRQLFLNIYSNCIKYNKPHGSITSRVNVVEETDTTLTLRWVVSDTGIGMSPEFLEHLFDPFTQEHTDARSVYQGTGLGMSIVKGLVERMHGTIEVQSQLHVGSTFIVTLPFEIADPALLRSDPSAAADHDISGLRLLLTEDNELNAEIAQTLLTDAGAMVTLAPDGQQAIAQFADHPAGTFDAILMDVMMPNVDGLTATRTIRAMSRPDARTIPILAMTANAFDEDARACLAAGMNAHLSKPLQIEHVKAEIAKYCRR